MKNHDWYYSFGDNNAWKKGKKENEVIRSMVDELGDDGIELYRMYGKKNGVIEGLTNEARKDPRPSHYEKFLYKKMKEWKIRSLDELEGEAKKRFDKELEDYEGDGEDEVTVNLPEQNVSEGISNKLKQLSKLLKNWDYTDQFSDDHSVLRKAEKYEDEIKKLRDGLGDEGRKMYFSFLKSKGILPSGHLESKEEIENRSMFPEMDQVTRKGLGYGEELYPEHLVPKWIPPSPQRTRGWTNK